MNKTKILCPNCDKEMLPVLMPNRNIGLQVEIEQCSLCGGIWCNRNEAYQLTPDSAIKLDQFNENLLRQIFTPINSLFCPNDKEPLINISDSNFPPDLQIKRCHLCEGIWFNKGALSKYKLNVASKQRDLPENDQFNKYNDSTDEMFSNPIARKVFEQLLPIPTPMIPYFANRTDKPFILNENSTSAIKNLPESQRIKVVKALAAEHNMSIEKENRFISITMGIINLIRYLL